MAPLSFSQEFIPAPQATNRRTATTYGHHHQYMRPGQPGPGWGDYDRFDHWQSCGRRLPEDLLDKDPEKRPANARTVAVMLGMASTELSGLDLGLASGVASDYVLPATPVTPMNLRKPAPLATPVDTPTVAARPEDLLD